MEKFPTERLYAHLNTTVAFVGEYLMYSVYCLDNQGLKPSKISKIVYVELIGEDLKPIFKQKLKLHRGRSYADFFVPTSIPSGNYKLIAYTQWMRNFDKNLFFDQDVTIINPYNSDQSVFLKKKPDLLKPSQKATSKIDRKKESLNREQNLTIQLQETNFKPRQKAIFKVIGAANPHTKHNLSISIRKLDAIPHAYRIGATSLSTIMDKKDLAMLKEDENIYLPEIRGDLISGKIVEKETGKAAQGIGVSLSIPKNASQFMTAFTNADGTFYFSISKEYESDIALLQVLGTERNKYQLEMKRPPSVNLKELGFYDFQLDNVMENSILERSFQNQIENAFFSTKPDTIPSVVKQIPFFLKDGLEYNLDDYTRFSTLRETVIEIVEHLWIARGPDGNRTFKVRVEPPYVESDKAPLLLIDGIHVQDQEALMDFNSRSIQRIILGRDRYVFGKQVYEGAISIETKEEAYFPITNGVSVKRENLFVPKPKKRYYQQIYGENEDKKASRIPDFRYQLLWLPQESFSGAKEFSFFTSDVKGRFEIEIEGFTSDGNPISSSHTFSVD